MYIIVSLYSINNNLSTIKPLYKIYIFLFYAIKSVSEKKSSNTF